MRPGQTWLALSDCVGTWGARCPFIYDLLTFPFSLPSTGGAFLRRRGVFGVQFEEPARIPRRSAEYGRSHQHFQETLDEIRATAIDRSLAHLPRARLFLRLRLLHRQKATLAQRRKWTRCYG